MNILYNEGIRELGITDTYAIKTFKTNMYTIQPPTKWLALSLGVKQLGREADHTHPSSAKVKKAWSYTSTPQHTFMAWSSVKAHHL
jgi:hypothetical protein